jgi:hypothetical protein
MAQIAGIKVYWDTQGQTEGWSCEIMGLDDEGLLYTLETSGLDAEPDDDPRELVVQEAYSRDIEIRADQCAYEPNVDGGWADWTRD